MSARKSALIAAIATLAATIATATEKQQALQLQVDAFDAIEAVDVGSNIVFLIGRADTRREVVGSVKAVRKEADTTDEEGNITAYGKRVFKVEYTETGDAFDAVQCVVADAQVLRVA